MGTSWNHKSYLSEAFPESRETVASVRRTWGKWRWGQETSQNINKCVFPEFPESERKNHTWATCHRFMWIPLPNASKVIGKQVEFMVAQLRVLISFYKNKTTGDCVPVGLTLFMQQISNALLPLLSLGGGSIYHESVRTDHFWSGWKIFHETFIY